MKAIICNEYGPLNNLVYGDMDDLVATGDQVVIEVKASGVNFPDGLLVQGKYQMKPPTPFVPGMEAAGIVKSVGPDVKDLKVGDRAATICSLGGYAEQVVVSEKLAFNIGPDMDFADATALLVGFGTSHHALKQRADLKAGETLVVFGAAGATGLAALQIGKIMGARVIGVASSEEKRKIALENGADIAIGYEDLKDRIKELTGGRGADVVYDVVGGDAFHAASRSMARNGRLLIIGFAGGDIPKLSVNLTLVKEYSVVGVFWGNFTKFEPEAYADNMRELIGWYANGDIRPMIEGRYPLTTAVEVLTRVLGRGATGKIVLVP